MKALCSMPRLLATASLSGLVLAASLGSVEAQASIYTVSATTDIWLAGQPDGSIATGNFGSDSAPANSPVQIGASAGNIFRFSVSGSTSVDANCFAGADGGCYPDESSYSPAPGAFNGIGSYKGPSNALLGVFLDNTTPSGSGGPASLDYTQASNIALAMATPLLNQIFFIGDGLTGTGSGSVQQFLAPTGATRLFIAVADSFGSSVGNVGALTVDVRTNASSPVPEPASTSLVGIALAALGILRRKKI